MSTQPTTSPDRADDSECQYRAGAYLAELIGDAPVDVRWDDEHHLQGHAQCAGREIVVIAPRDAAHHAVVLTAEDWDAIRVASPAERREMLRACAIETHGRLVATLAET